MHLFVRERGHTSQLEKPAYGRFSDISSAAAGKRCDFCQLRGAELRAAQTFGFAASNVGFPALSQQPSGQGAGSVPVLLCWLWLWSCVIGREVAGCGTDCGMASG